MNTLQAGFSRVDITPMQGIGLAGYYIPRQADGVLDPLEINALALADLKPAKMGCGIGNAPNIAFVRRFRMKDGSVRTNPGIDNPDIVAPIGDVDARVNVLRYDQENSPESFEMPLSAIAIGPVAMFGIPGEPFTGVGRAIKEAAGWELILPTCNTNAKEGYFPMMECYEEGGYEAGSSNFKAGVAELIIEAGLQLLDELKHMKA